MRWHSFWIIVVATLVTMATRFLPFLIFSGHHKTPKIITYLGMLVVYCLKDVQFMSGSFGVPEILSCGVVAGLHIWKRNALLSIGVGTVLYMVLVQLVF